MFGASALYHRFTWSPGARLWLRRVDHAGIFGLIAGTYTPFGLLVSHGAWQTAVLAVVWSGAAVAIAAKMVWVQAPKWISAAARNRPRLGRHPRPAADLRPFPGWPWPHSSSSAVSATPRGRSCTRGAGPTRSRRVFGYHEVFHVLVVAAVALQYGAVALVVN